MTHETIGRFEAKQELREVLRENAIRNQKLNRRFDPVTGDGSSGERTLVTATDYNDGIAWVPVEMIRDPAYNEAKTREAWVRLRCRHDFEYWAYMCATVRDKTTGGTVPLRLNAPQRRMARALEDDRRSGQPMRYILLKARQWGGSTLVQLYMAWIQTCVRTNWNSLICGHVKDAATNIRAMYTRLLDWYPREYWEGTAAPGFKSLERSANIRVIEGRDCRVTIGSSESQDAVRGSDYQMAHLSEVAFWRDSPTCSPAGFIRAVCGAINNTEMTLVVLESTANGVGNYFHREWLRAEAGESDKKPIFVPWYEIEIYRREVDDPQRLWNEMDDYERALWNRGLTLEMIAWFHHKRREYETIEEMQAEYPSTPTEAFYSVSKTVFDPDDLEALRVDCRRPVLVGEIAGRAASGHKALEEISVVEQTPGRLKLWAWPQPGLNRYVVTVDIGARKPGGDLSVIAVFDRMGGPDGDKPEIVAQWRGNIDHDLLAWKSVQIARFYNDALLVFESNTLETEAPDASLSVLSTVGRHYRNLYRRRRGDGQGSAEGFHTNRATKTLVVNKLIAAVREGAYVERDADAIDEMAAYQAGINGSFGAPQGRHDDIVMTRAIGLYVEGEMSPVRLDDNSLRRLISRQRHI